jgi:mono/diheme cytochrome c family protein
MKATLRSLLFLFCGAVLGALLVLKFPVHAQAPAAAQSDAQTPTMDLAALTAAVTQLKNSAPNQSHVMADVALMFSNVWYAADKKNWPLANYYLNETEGRLRWMIRINPMPKGPTGAVDIQAIFGPVDANVIPMVRQAIQAKDSAQFATAYKQMLAQCYACHVSTGRPYLKPTIPTTPPQSIINYDPDGTVPQ